VVSSTRVVIGLTAPLAVFERNPFAFSELHDSPLVRLLKLYPINSSPHRILSYSQPKIKRNEQECLRLSVVRSEGSVTHYYWQVGILYTREGTSKQQTASSKLVFLTTLCDTFPECLWDQHRFELQEYTYLSRKQSKQPCQVFES